MKKWTIILIVMLTVLNFGSFVLADEIDENTEVLANDGRVIMNFIDENYSPVVGASVHINLSTDNGMIDIRELGLNTVIVLESDQNGIVVINNLPYGFYEYYVDYVPLGYECLYTASNFFVSPAEDVAYVNVMFKEDVAMVAAPIEEVVKEEMEEEEEKEEEVVVPVQEEIITPIPRTEASVITTQVNTFTTKIYNVDDTTGTIEKKEEMNNTPVLIAQVEEDEQEIAVINKTIAKARERMLQPQEDMIEQFRKYRLIDCIRDKINQVDIHVQDFMKMIADLPDKKDKKLRSKDIVIDRMQDEKKSRMYLHQRAHSLFR